MLKRKTVFKLHFGWTVGLLRDILCVCVCSSQNI